MPFHCVYTPVGILVWHSDTAQAHTTIDNYSEKCRYILTKHNLSGSQFRLFTHKQNTILMAILSGLHEKGSEPDNWPSRDKTEILQATMCAILNAQSTALIDVRSQSRRLNYSKYI